ncbi:MAG: FHA domain-containing protein [Pirellulales bacterium]
MLQIRGTSRDGQVIRLKSAKCTIGSGRGSTLRLRARGIRKTHCLILRGPDRTVVRSWAADSRLNGRAFRDAALVAGDRLAVGPVEFEVLEGGLAEAAVARPEVEIRPPQAAPEAGAAEAEASRLSARRAELDRDLRELLQQKASLLERAARLDQERAAFEGRQQAFEDRLAKWETERAATTEGLAARSREMEQHLAEMQAQQRDLEAQREKWEAERNGADAQLAERWQEVERRLAELLAEERVLDDQREKWRTERVEADARVNEKCELIERQLADLQAERASWKQPARPSPEAEPEVPKASTVAEPEAPPLVDRATERPRLPTPNAAKPEPEESIDDYMARLMERVRGGKGEPGSFAIAAPAESAGTEREVPDAVASAGQGEPSRRPGRAAVPERLSDLSAMRELANVAARGALDWHSRKQLLTARYGKLLVAIMGLVCGIVLFNLSALMGDLTYYAAMMGFLVAVYWGLQYAVLTGHLRVSPGGRFSWQWRQPATSALPKEPGRGADPKDDQEATTS